MGQIAASNYTRKLYIKRVVVDDISNQMVQFSYIYQMRIFWGGSKYRNSLFDKPTIKTIMSEIVHQKTSEIACKPGMRD